MAAETKDSAAFARDLGYLDKFLTSLTAHAATLPGEQGARLKQLMAEEGQRWAEIKRLLDGQAPASNAGPGPAGMAVAPVAAVTAPALTGPPKPSSMSFTVGSLLGQPKK